jgi:hypothetical protein
MTTAYVLFDMPVGRREDVMTDLVKIKTVRECYSFGGGFYGGIARVEADDGDIKKEVDMIRKSSDIMTVHTLIVL